MKAVQQRHQALVDLLEEAGRPDYAAIVASVTEEFDARFVEWLEDPENQERWAAALDEAAIRLG